MSITPRTDAAAKELGKLAARYRRGVMTAEEFALVAEQVFDDARTLETERDRLRAEVEQKSNLLVTAIKSAGDQAARAERAELKLEKMATALADCISTFRSDDKTTIIIAERQEAWRAALLSYKPDHTFT